MALIDLTGKKFGRWTVLQLCADSGKVKFWECVCDCGAHKRVFGGDLKRGGSKSCGCLALEDRATRLRTHDMSFHRAYRNWIGAKGRCENPNKRHYEDYGGRGIKMCEKWSQSFEEFWKDMGPTWKQGLTLDRIDNHKGYEPDNCRWATAKEQANNRWDNRIIKTANGPMTAMQAAQLFGMNVRSIYSRLNAGWPDERLLDPPRFNVRWHKPPPE